jgi:hypothetical protein
MEQNKSDAPDAGGGITANVANTASFIAHVRC